MEIPKSPEEGCIIIAIDIGCDARVTFRVILYCSSHLN
jgi:hypothetical protein